MMRPRGYRDVNPLPFLHVVCAVFVVLWLSVGVASGSASSAPTVFKAAVLVVWVGLATIRSRTFLPNLVSVAWPAVAFLIVAIVTSSVVSESTQYVQGLCYFLLAVALHCFYSDIRRGGEAKVVLSVLLVDLAVTSIRTLIRLQSDPYLSRYLATTEENRTEVYGTQSFEGIAGYSHAYALGGIVVVLVCFAVRRGRFRAPIAAIGAGSGLFVLAALGFATAIILSGVFAFVFLIRDRISKPLQLPVAAAGLLCAVSGAFAAFFDALSSRSFFSEPLQERFSEFAVVLSEGLTSSGTFGGRVEYWQDSVGAFARSGPLGLAGTPTSTLDVGKHSQWLDFIGAYGLLVVPFFVTLVLLWRLTSRRLPYDAQKAAGRSWMYFLVLGLVNPTMYALIVLVWIFAVPALTRWMSSRTYAATAGSPQVLLA